MKYQEMLDLMRSPTSLSDAASWGLSDDEVLSRPAMSDAEYTALIAKAEDQRRGIEGMLAEVADYEEMLAEVNGVDKRIQAAADELIGDLPKSFWSLSTQQQAQTLAKLRSNLVNKYGDEGEAVYEETEARICSIRAGKGGNTNEIQPRLADSRSGRNTLR